jgi:hypothetical protein
VDPGRAHTILSVCAQRTDHLQRRPRCPAVLAMPSLQIGHAVVGTATSPNVDDIILQRFFQLNRKKSHLVAYFKTYLNWRIGVHTAHLHPNSHSAPDQILTFTESIVFKGVPPLLAETPTLMADEEVTAEAKTRTITHMNKDHQTDLALYLQHFAHLPRATAFDNPRLTDITLSSLTIRAGGRGTTHVVPFSPPMAGWGDRRARLAALSRTARAELDPVPFRGRIGGVVGWVTLVGVALFFVAWGAARLEPTWLAELLGAVKWPGGVDGMRRLTGRMFWPVVAIHATEAVHFDRTRLAPRGVSRGSAGWWPWVLMCAWVGFPIFRAFDADVAERVKWIQAEEKKGH